MDLINFRRASMQFSLASCQTVNRTEVNGCFWVGAVPRTRSILAAQFYQNFILELGRNNSIMRGLHRKSGSALSQGSQLSCVTKHARKGYLRRNGLGLYFGGHTLNFATAAI